MKTLLRLFITWVLAGMVAGFVDVWLAMSGTDLGNAIGLVVLVVMFPLYFLVKKLV
jgi:hypothetical protein